jgi:protein SCO1/2
MNCKEKKPVINSELTQFSTPIEGVLPYFRGDLLDPYWSSDKNLPVNLKHLPKFTLLTQQNEAMSKEKLKGKYTLVSFFYAKCNGVCPMITTNIKNLIPKLKNKEEITILSFSINPEIDTVDVLKKFREGYKIQDNNWYHLTGDKKLIYDIARNQFGADVKIIKGTENLTDFVHTENIYLLDKNFYLRGTYRAKGTGDLERLLVEMETLRSEKTN